MSNFFLKYITSFLFLVSTQFLIGQSDFEIESREGKEIDSLNQLANDFFVTNLDSAEFYALLALEKARYKNLQRKKGYLYYTLAIIYNKKGDSKKSFEYISLVSILLKELTDSRLSAIVAYQKANLFYSLSQFDLAMENVSKAIKFFEVSDNKKGLSSAYQMLANLYNEQKKYDQQRIFLLKAIELNKRNKARRQEAISYANYALYCYDLGEIDSAIHYMKKSTRISIEEKDTLFLAKNYAAISGFLIEQENFDLAFNYLNEAYKRLKFNPNPVNELELKKVEAAFYFEQQKYLKALDLFKSIREKSKDLNLLSLHQESVKGIYESFKGLNQFEQSLMALEEYNVLSDSILKMGGEERMTAMEMEFKFKIKEQEYIDQNNQLEILHRNETLESQNKLYLLLFILFLFALIISGGLYLLYKRKRESRIEQEKKEALTREIELKNKELVSNAMSVMRKNDEINISIDGLKRMRMKLNKSDQKELTLIIKNLNNSLNIRSWEDFEISFKQLYGSFYEKLLKKFPDLTQTELKVCSFLKLGLNSKQIAELMSKTSQSVEVDRSRIRKKMNLTNKKIGLQEYLMQEF